MAKPAHCQPGSGLACSRTCGLLQAKQHAELVQELQEAEESARKGHVGMWRYGDPGEDDEEDERPVKSAWASRAK